MLKITYDIWPKIMKENNFFRHSVKAGFVSGTPVGGPIPAYQALNKKGKSYLLKKKLKIRSSRYKSIADVAEVALKHEMGIGVPARPFMSPAFDLALISIEHDCITAVLTGQYKIVLNYLGKNMRNLIQNSIDTCRSPQNHPIIILAKGHNKPLIWDGKMRNSVTYRVSL